MLSPREIIEPLMVRSCNHNECEVIAKQHDDLEGWFNITEVEQQPRVAQAHASIHTGCSKKLSQVWKIWRCRWSKWTPLKYPAPGKGQHSDTQMRLQICF